MIVSDIFGGIGGGFKLDFYNNINQYISHTLLMDYFWLHLVLRIRPMPSGLKIAGLIVMLTGVSSCRLCRTVSLQYRRSEA